MNIYYYYNNAERESNKSPLVFYCEAENIIDADKLYKEFVGVDPRKQNFVGCQIVKKVEKIGE